MMAIAFMLISVVAFYWISYENRKFTIESDNVRTHFMESRKTSVQREVTRTLNYLTYVKSLSEEKLLNNLTSRVETAWNIANNIYQENKDKVPDHIIQKMIKDALRCYRINPSDDYVFIYKMNGETVLDPENETLEGKPSYALQDSLGNYVIKREIALLKEVDKGYLTYYTAKSPESSDSVLYKHSYVKRFKPFDWYIGSKYYLADFEENLKSEVLGRLADIRFDNDGYIFIQSVDNKPILFAGTIIKHNKSNRFHLEMQERMKISEIAKSGGGFVEYQNYRPGRLEKEPKISYVNIIDEWGWIVGAGFYTADVDDLVIQKRKELSAQRIKTFINIFVALFSILILGFVFTQYVNRRIMQGFERLNKFFKDASEGNVEIIESELNSPEFRSLAQAANKMVHELKDTRGQFEKEHSLLRSMMNSIPDLVFFKDIKSRYVSCNDAFLNYIQIKEEDLLGKTDFELFSKEAAEFYYNNDLKILKDGIPIRNEEWVTMPNGTECLFDTLKVLCHNKHGEVIGILCISRDMTERDQIQKKYIEAKEKAEESDRLKTAFLANMSHEIRTPMNSIVGFSNLIADGDLTKEEHEEYVGHINTGINNLLNIINDIIDIAKIEAGQLTVKPEYYSISKLIDEVYISTSEYKKKMNRPGVSFNCKIDEKLKDVKILVDPYRLNQILTNLIVNAIKFTLKGSIDVGCERRDNQLYFYVKDTGIGITEKDQQIIFKRFRQVGEGNGYKAGGTGLGLAISKHLVELMHGEVGVHSEKDKGSLFFFTIPFYPLLEEVNNKLSIQKVNWKDKHILIVESEDASYNYLKAVFSSTGANVLRVYSVREASEYFEKNNTIDLIYTDFNQLDDTTNNLMIEIKQKFPYIPIIGQANYPMEEENSSIHFDAVIIKPVQYHLLLQAISHIIKN